jgi:hypothetical protein
MICSSPLNYRAWKATSSALCGAAMRLHEQNSLVGFSSSSVFGAKGTSWPNTSLMMLYATSVMLRMKTVTISSSSAHLCRHSGHIWESPPLLGQPSVGNEESSRFAIRIPFYHAFALMLSYLETPECCGVPPGDAQFVRITGKMQRGL